MKRFFLCVMIFTVFFMFSGCTTTGILYTHVTSPLDKNMSQTPSGATGGQGDVYHLQFDVLGAAWDSNAIADIAKEKGMETVYYADIEKLRVLGLWSQYTVHVYGE